MNLDDQQTNTLAEMMIRHIPADGKRVGNITLCHQFLAEAKKQPGFDGIDDDDYWFVRDELLSSGRIEKGRGKGGSVRRILEDDAVVDDDRQEHPEPGQAPQTEPEQFTRELDLYEPLHDTIRNYWVKVSGIKHFVSHVTALQGRRPTGGKWTRPDITLVAVRVYPFIPGRSIEVISFEVKPKDYFGVDGVFEAAAFTAFAQRSYLAVHVSEEPVDNDDFDRLQRECERFGIGLMIFTDPARGETFDEIVSPKLHTPDPASTSAFIGQQMSSEQKQDLSDLIH